MTKIYVNVTCDLLHYGHISFFKKARDYGDYLIVGVCSDEEVALNAVLRHFFITSIYS